MNDSSISHTACGLILLPPSRLKSLVAANQNYWLINFASSQSDSVEAAVAVIQIILIATLVALGLHYVLIKNERNNSWRTRIMISVFLPLYMAVLSIFPLWLQKDPEASVLATLLMSLWVGFAMTFGLFGLAAVYAHTIGFLSGLREQQRSFSNQILLKKLNHLLLHPRQSRELTGKVSKGASEVSRSLNLLATMVTTTTCGAWLPGDVRGYVDDGRVMPSDRLLESESRRMMRARAVYLTELEQAIAFEVLIGACDEFGYRLIAVSIESWHAHVLLSHGSNGVAKVVGRLNNRMRQAVGRGRIWTEGYDKRYRFTEAEVQTRYEYIARHHGFRPLRGC